LFTIVSVNLILILLGPNRVSSATVLQVAASGVLNSFSLSPNEPIETYPRVQKYRDTNNES